MADAFLASDMANISVDWEVDGIITPQTSVSAMMKVLQTKTTKHTGTFWTWEGKVCHTVDASKGGDNNQGINSCLGIPMVGVSPLQDCLATRTEVENRYCALRYTLAPVSVAVHSERRYDRSLFHEMRRIGYVAGHSAIDFQMTLSTQ